MMVVDNYDSFVYHSHDIENRDLVVREGKTLFKGVKMAIFQKKLVSKQPIDNISVFGDKTLPEPELHRFSSLVVLLGDQGDQIRNITAESNNLIMIIVGERL